MKNGSIQLGIFAGIPLKLHWTFSLTFLLVIFIGVKNKNDLELITFALLMLVVMFLCVVLHEYGHALMARRFNIKTIDIILSPIGGLARLERLPKKPIQEFYIAAAGPLVNAGIAAIIAIILALFSKPLFLNFNGYLDQVDNWGAYLSLVLFINLILFIFNLIPAFPMDGGRILRALISIKLGKKNATIIATYIGYLLCVLFIIFGFMVGKYAISIIGVFVIFMARNELIAAKREDFLMNHNTLDPKVRNDSTFNESSPMSVVLEAFYNGKGTNFMVVDQHNELCGIITEEAIRKCIKDNSQDDLVTHNMETEYLKSAGLSLMDALNEMNKHSVRFLVAIDELGANYLIEKRSIYDLIKNGV